jgi:signal peptidase I
MEVRVIRLRFLLGSVALGAVLLGLMSSPASRARGSVDLRRGDVVLFRVPPLAGPKCGESGNFVERIVGEPGDVWSERHGRVFVNGRRLVEGYLRDAVRDSRMMTLRDIPPRGRYTRIPAGMYLLMGDRRVTACDSRAWGLVPRAAIERVLKRA